VHDFKKGTLIKEIENNGFEEVQLSDGYRYYERIPLDKNQFVSAD
jgi:hypothetical protein